MIYLKQHFSTFFSKNMFMIFNINLKVELQILPTLACKNLGPILVSVPMALATSDTLAPVASHRADMALILEIL